MKNRALAWWTYFRRGHQVYLVFGMAMLNFITIQHKLLIEKVAWLDKVFPNQWIFGFVCFAFYFPLSVFLGWLDYKKGSVPKDNELMAKSSPYTKDFMRAMILMLDGNKTEAKRILNKWS